MITCPCCASLTSPMAAACPKCGHPLEQSSLRTPLDVGRVVAVERTSKSLKLQFAIARPLVVTAGLVVTVMMFAGCTVAAVLCATALYIALNLWLQRTRLMTWWRHA